MALIKCPECGKEYSNLAQACPNCGCPTNVVVDTPKPQPDDSSIPVELYTKIPVHWFVKFYICLSVFCFIVSFLMDFTPSESTSRMWFRIFCILWLLTSMVGLFMVKFWGLVSFITFKILDITLSIIYLTQGEMLEKDFVMGIIGTAIIFSIFLIRKDGYSFYEALWNNGVIKEE